MSAHPLVEAYGNVVPNMEQLLDHRVLLETPHGGVNIAGLPYTGTVHENGVKTFYPTGPMGGFHYQLPQTGVICSVYHTPTGMVSVKEGSALAPTGTTPEAVANALEAHGHLQTTAGLQDAFDALKPPVPGLAGITITPYEPMGLVRPRPTAGMRDEVVPAAGAFPRMKKLSKGAAGVFAPTAGVATGEEERNSLFDPTAGVAQLSLTRMPTVEPATGFITMSNPA